MAEIVCNDGALYQTRRDTAQASGGADWVCVARGGRDGLTPTIRGTFDVLEKYARLDVDAMDGALFIAKRDSPGIFPVKIGNYSVGRASSAAAALRGESGERGEAAPTIVS